MTEHNLDWSVPLSTFTVSRGYTYHYKYVPPTPVATAANKPVLLFLHGFPEQPEVWSVAAAALHARHGNGVLLPYLLGYVPTSSPADSAEYALVSQVADLAEVLAHERIATVLPIGRDWGSPLCSRFPLLLPASTVVGCVLACVQFVQPSTLPQDFKDMDRWVAAVRAEYGLDFDNCNYFRFFGTDESTEVWDADVAATLLTIGQHFYTLAYEGNKLRDAIRSAGSAATGTPTAIPPPLAPAVQRWTTNGGFHGPLNWFRAMCRGHHYAAERSALGGAEGTWKETIEVPTLFYGGGNDKTWPPIASEVTRSHIPDLETGALENVGHAIYREDPQGEVELLDRWLVKKGFV
ncbi:hypothetical protein HK100_007613 [Physocladia obscura]|uniref:AB hydrolase-1 domain-containing protein n=1 Tax=Physocladia obscura TaxID=109957 RepID=A0AAD5XMJ9_9FUNG|nr:hypothetical protein HK100_007613 [Physocladia obscura]